MLSKGQSVLRILCVVSMNDTRSQIGLVLVGRHVFSESVPFIFEGAVLMESEALGAVQGLDMHFVSYFRVAQRLNWLGVV
jgi:hypothetical protein